jgi:hypothetical protein
MSESRLRLVGGDELTEINDRVKQLLDGGLSSEEIADDPMLASLAERIYGSDFLDDIGISRGATKRALVEQLSDDDILIDDIPDGDIPLPMPGDMPPAPENLFDEDDEGGRRKSPLRMLIGSVGTLAVLTNLFYGFGNFLSSCSDGHISCAENVKLNWMDVHHISDHIAWSPVGSIGIPDIVLAVVFIGILAAGFIGKRR